MCFYETSSISPTSQLIGLDDMGGWSQLSVQATPKWEFNVAAGTDNPFASDLRVFANPSGAYFPPLSRNQAAFVNTIYRPRSNLLLSAEYRHLRSYTPSNVKRSADHVNLAIGVAF